MAAPMARTNSAAPNPLTFNPIPSIPAAMTHGNKIGCAAIGPGDQRIHDFSSRFQAVYVRFVSAAAPPFRVRHGMLPTGQKHPPARTVE
jgi:hypothetical protein